MNTRSLSRCKKWRNTCVKNNLFSITISKSTTCIWESPWAVMGLAGHLVCQVRCSSGTILFVDYIKIHDHFYVEPLTLWPTLLKHLPHPICDTFPFCDIICICCLAGATSCPSETNQTTSQAVGLNRKGDNIASNPASYVALNPPSKKQQAKERDTTHLAPSLIASAKRCHYFHQNPKSGIFFHTAAKPLWRPSSSFHSTPLNLWETL